ncbi:MAG: type II secretion system protein [Pseudomonadota bacterium]
MCPSSPATKDTAARRGERGFTLIELAVVMLILGILLGGLLVPLSTQIEQRRITETQRALNDAREALLGFAMANGRLPCPADPVVASGSTNAGKERVSCTTGSDMHGVLPWATLGLPETDAWGRRFTYRVTGIYADLPTSNTTGCADTPMQSSYALCSEGDIHVCAASPCDSTSPPFLADVLPVVMVSHGKNGAGAWLSTGAQLAGAAGDEAENSDVDRYFISHPQTPGFDDLVVWIPNSILKSRTVAAARLP